MCAIIGSADPEMFYELYELNAYRGALSYSRANLIYNEDHLCVEDLVQERGAMPRCLVASNRGYSIGHSQAPTTESTMIHPAQVDGNSFLWHNGIIKQSKLPEDVWDTQWMLDKVYREGFDQLSHIDGSFACVMFCQGELFVFRNEISPLFIDDRLNISSTKFTNSELLPANVVYKMDIKSGKLIDEMNFETFENPYFFI